MKEQDQYVLRNRDGAVFEGDEVWTALQRLLPDLDGEWQLVPVGGTPRIALAQLVDALLNMLKEVEGKEFFVLDLHRNGTDIYTRSQWAEKGEKHCGNALFVIIHDGGPLAPYCNPSYEDRVAYEALRDTLAGLGLWAEQATAWYTGIYPVKP